MKEFLKNYTHLSDEMARVNTRGLRLIEPQSFNAKQRIAQFSFYTGDTAITSGDAAVVIPLVFLPEGHTIKKGVLDFGAMGTNATVDIGLYGADGSGRYDDTPSDTIIAGTTLVIGQFYEIVESGGDFSNVGAANNDIGTVFQASGTTPTSGKKVRQIGLADDRDLFLDGASVATAGQDTFASLEDGDPNALYKTTKDCVICAVADGANWAADKVLKGFVESFQY